METSRPRLQEVKSSSSSNAKAATLLLSQQPISLSARGRVVSLDRRDYPGVSMDYDASEDAGDSTTTDEDEEQRQRQRRTAIERQQQQQQQQYHHQQQQQQQNQQEQIQQPIYPSSYPRLDVTDDIHHEDDSDDYSSDGESSYFSEHLPSPKSAGRRSSFSTALSSLRATKTFRPMIPGPPTGAASRLSPRTIPTGPMTSSKTTTTTAPHSGMPFRRQAAPNHGRESDASLSFSDEDEEPPLVIQHHGAILSSTENVPPPPVLSPLSASDTNASPKNLPLASRRTAAGVSTSLSASSQKDLWVDKKKGTIVPLRPPDVGDDQLRLFPVRHNRLNSSSSL
eukprot:scaffold5582_cov55-Attheya_sp.AAC.5